MKLQPNSDSLRFESQKLVHSDTGTLFHVRSPDIRDLPFLQPSLTMSFRVSVQLFRRRTRR